jgi:hypothetical protein
MVTLEIRNTQHGVPRSVLPGYHVNPGHLRHRFFRRLSLPAATLVTGGTWRCPATEGEDSHLDTFLGGQAGGGVGRLLLRANSGSRPSSPWQRFVLL